MNVIAPYILFVLGAATAGFVVHYAQKEGKVGTPHSILGGFALLLMVWPFYPSLQIGLGATGVTASLKEKDGTIAVLQGLLAGSTDPNMRALSDTLASAGKSGQWVNVPPPAPAPPVVPVVEGAKAEGKTGGGTSSGGVYRHRSAKPLPPAQQVVVAEAPTSKGDGNGDGSRVAELVHRGIVDTQTAPDGAKQIRVRSAFRRSAAAAATE
jgi:hypothetical protein